MNNTNTHSEYVTLLSQCHNGHTNASEGYVIRTLPVLLLGEPRGACGLTQHSDRNPALNWSWGLLVVWEWSGLSFLVWSGLVRHLSRRKTHPSYFTPRTVFVALTSRYIKK